MEFECPHCGRVSGYDVPESYKGNVSCPWCPNSFYVELEKGKTKAVNKEAEKKWPKSIRVGTKVEW